MRLKYLKSNKNGPGWRPFPHLGLPSVEPVGGRGLGEGGWALAGARGELRNRALVQPLRSTQPLPRWASVSPSEQGVAARVPEGSFQPRGRGFWFRPCFCSVSIWSEASPSLSHSPHLAHGPGSGYALGPQGFQPPSHSHCHGSGWKESWGGGEHRALVPGSHSPACL